MTQLFYGHFYGLRSPPFHITPDPGLLMLTEIHRQAVGALLYAIRAGKGFVVVTGEVGVGKTTILHYCLDQLDKEHTRMSTCTILTYPAAVFSALQQELVGAAATASEGAETIIQQLQIALIEQHRLGNAVVLAIDEAQNMPEDTLEALRLLSNLETAREKLIQILLVGQPELDALLARRSLRQVAQRVAVRAYIGKLSWRQSCRYVQHRLVQSGRPIEPPLFTTTALWYLAFAARGVPRTLNVYCDNALINGFGHRARRITLRIAREAARSLRVKPAAAARARTAAACGLAALIAAGVILYRIAETSDRDPAVADRALETQASQAAPVPAPPRSQVETPATAATSAHDIASPTTKTPLPASAPPALPKKAEASAAAHAATLPPARAAAEMQTAHLAAKPAARSGSTASATSPTARLSNAEIAGPLARGDDLLRVGDVASARLFYERAAEAGNGQAALRMAATFEAAFLVQIGAPEMAGDPAKARFWYERARKLGAARAPPSSTDNNTK